DPTMAASFAATIASAANGDAVYKRSSFFAGTLGKKIGPEIFSIVDDGVRPRGFATAPFDGEGVPTRRTAIVDKGVLNSFRDDWFTGWKPKARTTANAARADSSLPVIETNNLHLEADSPPPEDIIREVKNAFYVTAMLGVGANIVTGEYSRGANGLWIEN